LYNLTILGFSPKNFETIVDGIIQAILIAHDNLAPGVIKYNEGELLDTSINRSEVAYDENPDASQYQHNTNKTMYVLRLERPDGTEIGAISWFGVHPTSVSNFHHLISADNKGHCEHLFELDKGTDYTSTDTFVAACANAEQGDSSPNVMRDINDDGDWDGEGMEDDFLSCAISGERQYLKFKELYDAASVVVSGPIDYRHQFHNFEEFQLPSGHITCQAAIGASMLAGAEDGPGVGSEGITCPTFIFPCPECHNPKPVSMWIGNEQSSGNPRTPIILPVQIIRIGNLLLMGAPSEWTTMSGRRLRNTVSAVLQPAGVDHYVMVPNSNAYAGYVATFEAYQVQHYEGASTHFGPHTLEAYIWSFEQLAMAMHDGQPTPSSVFPPDRTDSEWSWLEPEAEMLDCPLPGLTAIGDMEVEPQASYTVGDTVSVAYSGAHPNRDYFIQQSFYTIERNDAGTWTAVALDWDPNSKLHWELVEVSGNTHASRMTIEWLISEGTPAGEYRISFQGYWAESQNTEHHFTGQTQTFQVQ
jgi:neutral ceramidase